MKLPSDAVIAPAKLNRFLLVPQKKGNDKAAWLASAGYRLDSWPLLRAGLREQILTLNAVIVEDTVYGKMLEIAGELKGPNGAVLAVRTFWIMETITGLTKFVTLYPDKR